MNDLEFLREMFSDTRLHFGIGTIAQLGLSTDNATLRVKVNLLPENREVIASMAWSDVNDVTFPEKNDLVLLGFVDGHPDEAFVIKLCSSKEELIPKFARTGHSVKQSRDGKKLYLASDTKVAIGRPETEPTEPLALGNVLKSYLTTLEAALEAIITQLTSVPATISTAPGNLGIINPALIVALNLIKVQAALDKGTYLTTSATNIVSQIAFTERGI